MLARMFLTILAMTSVMVIMSTTTGCAQNRTGSQMKTVNNAKRLSAGEWDQFANWMKNSMIQRRRPDPLPRPQRWTDSHRHG